MEVPLDWTCPICGHIQDNVAYGTPCHHQLWYSCALWWAKKQQECAICGHKIRTIRYSERSDDDYLSALPSPQHAQVMACRASRSLQSRCCCLLSTAFLLRSGLPFSNNTREISARFSGSIKRSGGSPLTGGGRCSQEQASLGTSCAGTGSTRPSCCGSCSQVSEASRCAS